MNDLSRVHHPLMIFFFLSLSSSLVVFLFLFYPPTLISVRVDPNDDSLGPTPPFIQDDFRAFRRQLDDKRPLIEQSILTGRQLVANETPLSDASDSEGNSSSPFFILHLYILYTHTHTHTIIDAGGMIVVHLRATGSSFPSFPLFSSSSSSIQENKIRKYFHRVHVSFPPNSSLHFNIAFIINSFLKNS